MIFNAITRVVPWAIIVSVNYMNKINSKKKNNLKHETN